jgi:hypothetical protein
MSLVSYNPENQLDEYVLLVIFDHLDDKDLLRCEAVCQQWRNIILSGTPWRRLLHRKIVSSSMWREVWEDFGVDEKKLETLEYRGLYKKIIQEVNTLKEDVLLVIFDYLDEEDLLRCEAVCRKWRKVLLSGRPWKGLFHRKIVSSSMWREVWWDFGVDENRLQAVHYRGLYKTIDQEVNEIERNWRTGNF